MSDLSWPIGCSADTRFTHRGIATHVRVLDRASAAAVPAPMRGDDAGSASS